MHESHRALGAKDPIREGPGNYIFRYCDLTRGLLYSTFNVSVIWRDSANDIKKKLEENRSLTKGWLVGQLLLWGITEQKGLERKRKDDLVELVGNALSSGKVR